MRETNSEKTFSGKRMITGKSWEEKRNDFQKNPLTGEAMPLNFPFL
jgi:hypothetical protein